MATTARRRRAAAPADASARARILAATLRVIADQGLEAVTHRRVAALAGVSPGSTTHHFASRDDLLREAFRTYLHGAGAVLADLDAAARRARRGVVPQLLAFCGALVEHEFRDPRLVRAEYELLLFAARDPALAEDYRGWEVRLVAGIAARLEAGGAARPVDAARSVLDLVRGFELERLLDARLTAADLQRRLGPVLAGLVGDRP